MSLALALLVLVERYIVFPRLLELMGLPLPLRATLVFAMIAPLGVALGVFFPAGLEALKRHAPEFVPWAWGINGIFSVLAPVLGVAFSMTYGMKPWRRVAPSNSIVASTTAVPGIIRSARLAGKPGIPRNSSNVSPAKLFIKWRTCWRVSEV